MAYAISTGLLVLLKKKASTPSTSVLLLDYGYGTTNHSGNVVIQRITLPTQVVGLRS